MDTGHTRPAHGPQGVTREKMVNSRKGFQWEPPPVGTGFGLPLTYRVCMNRACSGRTGSLGVCCIVSSSIRLWP